jgi:hypothetical protein
MPRTRETPLSASEVAAATGYDISTICRWARAGDIPAGKLPGLRGAWLIDPSVLETIRQKDRSFIVRPKGGRTHPQA